MANESQKALWSWVFHIAFLSNAVLGIFEFVTGYRLTPYVAGTVLIEQDWRSTSFFGHPLSNATLTGCYILIIAFGGAREISVTLRVAMLLLQMIAMIAFGGRAALSLAILILVILGIIQLLKILHGQRVRSLSIIIMIVLIPISIFALIYAIENGFFDRLMGRFVNDEGSAKARLIMLDLFEYVSWFDLLLGPDPQLIATFQNNQGIEFGIESFWIGFIMNYGLIISMLFFSALLSFSWKIANLTSSGSGIILFYFYGLASTSVSLSAKDILLGILVAMLMCLMRRPIHLKDDHHLLALSK